MGIPSSKFGKEIPKDEVLQGSVPSTPILTPKSFKASKMDPRSPSSHIARTPLEVLSAAADKLESFSQETPIRNKVILGIDPRSPTTDFKRTPIIISTNEGDLPKKLRNKNLEKVLNTELKTSPTLNGEKLKTSPKSAIPPKLLQSSPIKQRSDAYKRRSLVGLLETNIDFTETDLDLVLKEECKIEINQNITETIKEFEHIIPENEVTTEENDVEKEITEINNILFPSLEKIQNDGEQCGVVDFQSNPTVHEAVDIPNETQSANVTPPSICLSPILPSKEIKSAPQTPPINLTANVKELDKKLTNLIYEDDLVVCPRIVKLKDNIDRSPLRNVCNEPKIKSTQKLKVSDKPRRNDYAVSKIPVFKETKGKIRNGIQCENTPPRNMEKNNRHKKTDWDSKDHTLYL